MPQHPTVFVFSPPHIIDIKAQLAVSRLVKECYSEILHNISIQSKKSPTKKHVFDLIKKRVIQDATWAITEVSRGQRQKYFHQRYISQEVYRKWIRLNKKGGRVTLKNYCHGLRHEHVHTRKLIATSLSKATTKAALKSALNPAVACVVTKAEEKNLNTTTGKGWGRYRKAKIKVFDVCNPKKALHYPR